MGISLIREENVTNVLITISRLMKEGKQITLTQDDGEWVIAYTNGPAHAEGGRA